MKFSLTFKSLTSVQMAHILVTADAYGAPEPDVAMHEPGLSVLLDDAGQNKIQVIKTIREVNGMGLKEAKDLIEQVSTPRVVASRLSRNDAEVMRAKLVEAGAMVRIVEP